MSVYEARLREIESSLRSDYVLTAEDRDFLHNAYWQGNSNDISMVLQVLCWEPDPLDMPILLDASSPGTHWVFRCDAAQALAGLSDDGRRVLLMMANRETHPVVRMYVNRELIDLGDESCLPLLDGPVPPKASPYRRELWIYGNYEREALSKERALKLLEPLLSDRQRRFEWLLQHLEDESPTAS